MGARGRPAAGRGVAVIGALALAFLAPPVQGAPGGGTGPDAAAERVVLARATVREGSGSYHADEHVTFGVPLRRGAVRDPDALRVWRTDDGRALPVQARSLSRWPDDSVRWALVDTRLELQARQEAPIAVGLADELAAAPAPWTLIERDGELLLDDGQRRRPVLSRGPRGDVVGGLRARLVDRFGHVYRAHVGPVPDHTGPGDPLRTSAGGDVEWMEWGPLRAVARIRGAHRAADEGGLPIDFHTFTAYLHFHAGSPRVEIEWSLENGPLHDPPGRLAFASYELLLDPAREPTGVDVPGAPSTEPAPFALRQLGPLPSEWDYTFDGRFLPPGRGGDLWAGLLDDRDRDAPRGVYVHLVQSALEHPSALRYEPGGPLVVGLLPQTDTELFLDDATRKTFRLALAWDVGRAGRAEMTASVRPSHVALDPRDVAASGAWGDAGLLYVPGAGELRGSAPGLRDPPTGWAHWGEWLTRNTHSTGSPRNRLSVFLEAVQSGSREQFELARARAWHAMDMRPYHIFGFSAERYPEANLFEGVPHPNEKPEVSLGRKELDARHPEYKRGLPDKGHGYNGFDPEHMTLDDVYECYLLTGSWQALCALRSAGEAMLTWHWVKDDLHSSRAFGWTLRALVQVHRATGDPRYLDAAAGMVAMADAERGRGAIKYLRPSNKPDKRHIADQASESPWMVAVAMHGLCAYYAETGDERVPPMLADLTEFCLSGLRPDGFVADIPLGGPATGGEVYYPTGTSQWVPGAVAAAAFVTGDHGPVDRIYPYYELMGANSSEPTRFGSESWHWWQPYLLSLQARYGSTAPRELVRGGEEGTR